MQMDTQLIALKSALDRLQMEMIPESPREVWLIYEGLREQISAATVAKRDVEKMECQPERFWSLAIVAIYAWATKDRFSD